MKKLPDFEAWAMFAAVTREGSFAKAAAALGVSQATVSKAITRLEQRIKTTLFHRTSRHITLTESGYSVLDEVNDLVNLGDLVEEKMSEQASAMRGLIRISSPMSFGLNYLAPLLPSFMQQHPDVELDVKFDDRQVDLVAEGFDLSLRISDLVDSTLLAQRLCTTRLQLVGAPSYFAKHGKPTHPSELDQHKALLYAYDNRGAHWRFHHEQYGDYSQALPSSCLRVNNGDALLPVLKQGGGVAVMPDFLTWEALREGELVEVMPEWTLAPLGLFIVTPPSRLRPVRVDRFIQYLKEHLSTAPWRQET
ncbi:LysR family transcriptional regulator [Aliidiomarina taiwanensis]|uniref:LysR family transcriptional regulator n=1 Tax=Aliidiomarina taiwanensis TaxID=946228 RepID=A0A432WTQ6_9GAMM|nr:LysR family transcriptional regulator [Aliidiomarina taiwanensis]RUO37160.1 LysR family transcriptional regulator [Aliidiomarina taiwanensis]